MKLRRRSLVKSIGLAPAAVLAPAGIILTARATSAAAAAGRAVSDRGATEREVTQVIDAQPTTEGAGVRLRRSLGSRALSLLDPFLMLDEFHSSDPADYMAGFPSHPHRGFETVTYMLHGAMEHRDSLGNHGRLGAGSTQWMTAGHGIIHSEMPQQNGAIEKGQPKGLMWGFQLWVNLPAARKLTKPRYQDLPPAAIVETTFDGAAVRLVAGEANGKRGPVDGIVTAPQMLDVRVPARGSFRHRLPGTHAAFLYVFEGTGAVGSAPATVTAGQLAVLSPGDVVKVRAGAAAGAGDAGARFLLLAGRPIGEPVARYGPFVMNTEAELRQAVEDYRAGRLVGG